MNIDRGRCFGEVSVTYLSIFKIDLNGETLQPCQADRARSALAGHAHSRQALPHEFTLEERSAVALGFFRSAERGMTDAAARRALDVSAGDQSFEECRLQGDASVITGVYQDLAALASEHRLEVRHPPLFQKGNSHGCRSIQSPFSVVKGHCMGLSIDQQFSRRKLCHA